MVFSIVLHVSYWDKLQQWMCEVVHHVDLSKGIPHVNNLCRLLASTQICGGSLLLVNCVLEHIKTSATSSLASI